MDPIKPLRESDVNLEIVPHDSHIELEEISVNNEQDTTSKVVYVVFSNHSKFECINADITSVGFAIGDKHITYPSMKKPPVILDYNKEDEIMDLNIEELKRSKQLSWPISVSAEKYNLLLEAIKNGNYRKEGGITSISRTVHCLNSFGVLSAPFPFSEEYQ